jgi:hypothetical protein
MVLLEAHVMVAESVRLIMPMTSPERSARLVC